MQRISPTLERINRQALGLLTVSVVVIVGILLLLKQNDILGPIRDDSDSKIKLQWKISDHTSTNNTNDHTSTNNTNVPLSNTIDGKDVPKYNDADVLGLKRAGNGDLDVLPRFQGELDFYNK